ncbi:MAG: CvpA family protein [Planctomycetes bacterium]|nr:CvpA family protein [Planctomycetota bacterium]
MWFSLFATVLILAVTFYQGLQGLFSALINCVLTILAAALAFAYFEDLYQGQLMSYQPDHGRAIALMAVFIVSLLILRTIVDLLIKGNQTFPIYVDRAGGGIFGFITAMVIIGMLSIGFQMLPFDVTFLGFSRYSLVEESSNKEVVTAVRSPTRGKGDEDKNVAYRMEVDWAQVKTARHNLWLNPDGFTVGLVSHLSRFALQGRNSFADANPDFLDYIHHMRDGLGRESLEVVPANAVTVKQYEYLRENEPIYRRVKAKDENGTDILKYESADRKPKTGERWLCVTVAVSERTDKCQDRAKFNFTSSQVRLLARDRDKGPVKVYPLAGINESDPANSHRLIEVFPCQDIQYSRAEGSPDMRLLFEVPDSPGFQTLGIQYKMNARAEIRSSHDHTEARAGRGGGTSPTERPSGRDRPRDADAASTGTEERPSGPRNDPNPRDRVHGVNLAAKEPFFSDKLPFAGPLTDYSEGMDFDRSGQKLRSATSLTVKLDSNWEPANGSKQPLESFDVPENARLLQVNVERLQPGSSLGKILQTTVEVVRNIYLIDSNNKQYMPVGKYAIATIRGETIFELTYLDETARGFVRMRGFEHIRFEDLKGQYAYVFLFHLPPGAKPAKFHTGRANIALDQFNLVAPK